MRRAGVQTDVSASDIAEAVRGKRNPAKAAIAYLLKIGFTPTQIADSFAISAGGKHLQTFNQKLKKLSSQVDLIVYQGSKPQCLGV